MRGAVCTPDCRMRWQTPLGATRPIASQGLKQEDRTNSELIGWHLTTAPCEGENEDDVDSGKLIQLFAHGSAIASTSTVEQKLSRWRQALFLA